MPNSLGTLSESQIDPHQDTGEVVGMRGATGYEGGNFPPRHPRTKKPPHVGPPEELVDVDKLKSAPPVPVKRSPEQIAELIRDCGQAITRVEKAIGRGQPAPELAVQLKTELLNLLLAELLTIERAKARLTLESLYAERWRRFISRIDLDRFASIDTIRKAMMELVTSRPEEFPAVARAIFDSIKDKFPSPDPVCQAGGS